MTMVDPSQQPAVGGDLQSLIQGYQLGSQLSFGDSMVEAEEVYEGEEDTEPTLTLERRNVIGIKPVLPKYTPPGKKPKTRPLGEVEKDLYRKKPGELPAIQKRLFDAGFYDESLEWSDIRVGDYDTNTEQAWRRAVQRAAAFYGADQKLTLDQVIDQSIMARQADPNAAARQATEKKAKSVIQLTHPDDIRTQAMKTSSTVLGRGWSKEELDRFVTTYQQMERAAQQAAQSGGVVAQQPSLDAAAERAARQSNPIAAESTDMVNAYSMILESFDRLGAQGG